MRAFDHRLPGQGRSQGGGGGAERVCAPLGFSGTCGQARNSGRSNRNPHRCHEICAETDKKARQVRRGPYDQLVPREKQGPCDYQDHSDPSEYQGPSDYQRPSQLSGAL